MRNRLIIALLTASVIAGCGESRNDAQEIATPSGMANEGAPAGVTAAVTAPHLISVEDGNQVGGNEIDIEQDPVVRLLAEIRQLLIRSSGSTNGNNPNSTIVLKATEVLRLTMEDSSRQTEFLDAIRHLLHARLQMALTGTSADIDLLYADVRALNERDPESAAAAEGIYYLAKFAHTKARQFRQKKAEWNVNFSRWAREFSDRFPEQSERSLSLLFGAGRSCEMTAATAASEEESALLKAEARLCYVQLMRQWPKEPQGQEAVAVLRRLNLPGRKLSQFAGPGLSGNPVNSEQFAGKVTLIYFWDSESDSFTNDWLPLLKKAESQLPANRIRYIGVNLDDDPHRFRKAVVDLAVPGEQIFFQNEKHRGWNSPLVRFWGVSQSPSVWLVDSAGVVDAVDVRREAFASRITPLIRVAAVAPK